MEQEKVKRVYGDIWHDATFPVAHRWKLQFPKGILSFRTKRQATRFKDEWFAIEERKNSESGSSK